MGALTGDRRDVVIGDTYIFCDTFSGVEIELMNVLLVELRAMHGGLKVRKMPEVCMRSYLVLFSVH